MPLASFSDDAQRVAGGLPSQFAKVSRSDGATAVALAAATALKRCGWSPSSLALSPAAASAPWPGRPGSEEWVFPFECPGRANPFELHVSHQQSTQRMLAQLREMIPARAAGPSAPSAAAAGPSPPLTIGASSVCGLSVNKYWRLPGEKGEDETDDTTVDAEVVDAGDGDEDDSWRRLLKNTGPLEAMVSGLLAAPAAENAVRGPSPREREKKRKVKLIVTGLLGAVVAAVVGVVAKNNNGSRSEEKKPKRK